MNIILKFKDEWLQEYRDKEEGQEMAPAWIFFEHMGEYYPDDDWIDNPAVILGWWLYSLEEMLEGREGQGIDFMEGPFFIEAHIINDILYFNSEEGKITWKLNKIDFAKELMRAVNTVARKFHSVGLTKLSKDLNNAVESLKLVVKKLQSPSASG